MRRDEILEKVTSYRKDPPYGDCRLRCFSQITGLYGERISEEDLFGLGHGLMLKTEIGTDRGIMIPVLVGRTERAEIIALEKLGYAIEENKYRRDALERDELDPTIREYIEEGEPVLFECNVKQMPYIHKPHLNDNTRHLLMLFDYEESSDHVVLLDGLTNTVEKISVSTLIRAHTETGTDERETSWYRVTPPTESIAADERDYRKSLVDLNENYKLYQSDVFEFLNFLQEFQASAHSTKKQDYLRMVIYLNCIFVRKMEEIHGTFYRTIYRKYLENLQAKDVLPLEDELPAFRRVENKWKTISFQLRYKNKDILDSVDEFISTLDEINKEEVAILDTLAEKAKKGC